MYCRHCQAKLVLPLIDLGAAPPSNAYLSDRQLLAPEKWFPLRVFCCTSCWLVQTEDYAHHGELFSGDYAYFSSFSSTWLAHSKTYVSDMSDQLGLGAESRVVEVAANDGYLLQFVKARGIPCLGVEPTKSTAEAARAKGISIREEFFGLTLACRLVEEGWAADLAVANNVLAHVPDINDFVEGFAALLKPQGVATFEFPHLLRLVEENQFDTIYHEHFSYLSLTAVQTIFERNGLRVMDVEKLATHGGSLRVHAQRADVGRRQTSERVSSLLAEELSAGVKTERFYQGLQSRADRVKDELLTFLIDAKRAGKTVMGYGAAAKGNTLLNYSGVRGDLIAFVVDLNPAKQDKFMPGSRIPIISQRQLEDRQPDFILILPWNLKDEIKAQLAFVKSWGGRFVTALPKLSID